MSVRQRSHRAETAPEPGPVAPDRNGPHLWLVASSGHLVGTFPQARIPAQRRRTETAPVPPVRSTAPRRSVRLTRRGRAVVWVLLVAAAIVAMALLAPASQAAAPPGPVRTVTVHRGDTMWSIASAMLPGESPGVAIERIRVLNHLSDDEVYVGEQLLIPAA